jgi:Zn-dependent protease with chaperone function
MSNIIIEDEDTKKKFNAITNAMAIINFFSVFYESVRLSIMSKEDKLLSDKVNKLYEKNRQVTFKIKVIPVTAINAFVSADSILHSPGKITVFLYGGLVNLLGRDSRELTAIILHEIGHALKFHMLIGMYTNIITNLGLSTLLKFILKDMKLDSLIKQTLAVSMLIMIHLLTSAAEAFVSRSLERQADEYVIKVGYGKDLANALSKMKKFKSYSALDTECGKICKAIKYVENTLASHPETEERIKDLLSKDATLKALQSKNKGEILKLGMKEVRKEVFEYVMNKNILNG